MGSGLLAARPARAADGRPNVLFILTDDQRYDAMSCVGYPDWLRTPNMDRIRHEGALFSNAFVTISLCSPSRACFLTGCYAHTHGVRTNETNDPDPALPTFPRVLQQAGYDTGFIGKWHMAPKADPRPGFDYWLSFLGQGRYEDPPLNENGREFRAEGYMTDLLTGYALRFLERDRSGPFCLYLSHKAVHGPFTPAQRHKDLYPDAEIPRPAGFDDTFRDKPEWIRAGFVRGARAEQWRKNRDMPVPPELPPGEWDPKSKGRIDYYRCLAAVDEGIGQILDALRDKGELDNTVIIFAGDNGYFHGEHRRGDKRLMYEESLRIPMTIRYPALVKPGSTVDDMVLNIDVAPTLIDLAGLAVPPTVQGLSMRPLLAGESTRWRSSFLYEYFREGWLPGIPTMLGVRTRRHKFITYPQLEDLDELYDLQADPLELTNLAVDPAHDGLETQLRDELHRLLEATEYREPPRPNARVPLQLVLAYDFDQDEAGQAVDRSGNGNVGAITGTELVDGERNKARSFSHKDFIQVAKSQSLNCAGKPLTVMARVSPQSKDGVILARGGQSHGYALYLDAGRPTFAVRLSGGLAAVSGPVLPDGWVHLAGVITADAVLKLYVDGRPVDSAELPEFLARNPNEDLQVGMDRGTLVGDYDENNGYSGLIGEVAVYAGAMPEEQIAAESP